MFIRLLCLALMPLCAAAQISVSNESIDEIIQHNWEDLSAEEQLLAQQMGYVCYLGCHKAARNNIPETIIPLLDGLDPQYILNQWRDFDAERFGGIASQMKLQVYEFTPELTQNIALYYGTRAMRWEPKPDVIASETYARGKVIYERDCSYCHGQQGASTNPLYPPLKGQMPGYIFEQMKAYRDKKRNNRAAPVMQAIAQLHSEEEWKDIIAYVSGQFYVPVKDLNFISGIDMPPIEGFVLPDTGQIQDFSDTFGEDSDYPRVPTSYTISESGKVTIDNNTKLMWERDSNRKWMQSKEIVEYCDNLELDGYTDWRLPLMKELQSIADYGEFLPAIDMEAFLNMPRLVSGIWTFPRSDHPEHVWHIGFPDGHVMGQHTYSRKLVRCVRADNGAAYHANSFIDNGDGTVTDNVTKRVWQQNLDYVRRSWDDAINYCENLEYADRSDWRLPNLRELISIVDYNRYEPAIDEEYFPNTPIKYFFWSSTSYVGGPLTYVRPLTARKNEQPEADHTVRGYEASMAWPIGFQIGSGVGQRKETPFWVRCVADVDTSQ